MSDFSSRILRARMNFYLRLLFLPTHFRPRCRPSYSTAPFLPALIFSSLFFCLSSLPGSFISKIGEEEEEKVIVYRGKHPQFFFRARSFLSEHGYATLGKVKKKSDTVTLSVFVCRAEKEILPESIEGVRKRPLPSFQLVGLQRKSLLKAPGLSV